MRNHKIVFVIYVFVLIMMTTAACLVAADVLVPENGLLAAILVVGFVMAIVADFMLRKSER